MSHEATPACPRCGGNTERRRNQYGSFFGCVDYPECNGLVRIAEEAPRPRKQIVQRAIRERQLTPGDADLLGVLPRPRFSAAVSQILDILAQIEAEVMGRAS